MRSLLVRTVCAAVNFLVGDSGPALTADQERELTLARSRDPYFHAFRARCLQWVYGDDPRRAIEQQRINPG